VFKRLFWMGIGASFGFGASFWLTRAVKQTVARLTPERVSADVTASVKGFGNDLRDAMREGKVAMREREAALRTKVGARPG